MRGKKVLFILSLTVLVLFLLVGVFADFLAPCDPNAVDMANGLAAPSTEHWLGTAHIGRDLLSRLIYGSRSSVFIAFFATGCTLLLGMTIGLVSGYLGGWIDQLIQAVVNIFQGIPSAAFVVAILGLLGPGMRSLLIAIVVSSWAGFSRIVRNQVLRSASCTISRAHGPWAAGASISCGAISCPISCSLCCSNRHTDRLYGAHRGRHELPGPGPAGTRSGLGDHD